MVENETEIDISKKIFYGELFLLAIPRLICFVALCVLAYLFFFNEESVTWFVTHALQSVDKNTVFGSILLLKFFNIFCLALLVWSGVMIIAEILRVFITSKHWVLYILMIVLMLAGHLVLTHYLQPLPIIPLIAYLLFGFVIWLLNTYILARSQNDFTGRKNFNLLVFVAVTPVISDVFFLPLTMSFMCRALSIENNNFIKRVSLFFSVTISLSLISAASFALFTAPWEHGKTQRVHRLEQGDFYSMQIDDRNERLFACDVAQSVLFIYDLSELPRHQEVPVDTGELQDMRYNSERKELYHFNRSQGREMLMVLDAATGMLKKSSTDSLNINGSGSARVAFDNVSRTIAVTREDDVMFIFDMDTLLPIKRLDIADRNEFILFNENSRHFVISYFDKEKRLMLVSPRGDSVHDVPAPKYQGGMALSRKLKELYVAMPLRSMIYVYDSATYRLKRKIRTEFGVRNLDYDEDNKIIVTASLVNGYADVIDAQTGRRIDRIFLGYYLREVSLDTKRKRAFVSSMIGGIYFFSY